MNMSMSTSMRTNPSTNTRIRVQVYNTVSSNTEYEFDDESRLLPSPLMSPRVASDDVSASLALGAPYFLIWCASRAAFLLLCERSGD